MQIFDYLFNVNGNYTAKIEGMSKATGDFEATVKRTTGTVGKIGGWAAQFNVINEAAQAISNSLDNFTRSGITLDAQMHDLSAVAGVTGDGLKQIEGYARESAKAFGTDAAQSVEGYKLLLSQLTPELGKCPEALKAMGESIQTTSKLMGGDGTAAAEVLTTAMNQYGVSLADPIEASRTMASMMNVMAAAGQEGSAELPAIKVALEQCGMAAKAANVSFEETNAAIQVLDKAGKKGAEGGVALRNTLSILGQGRFMPKATREALEKAGVDVLKLADTSKTLKERLGMLKPIMNDSALVSALFGRENANAALALMQGSDEMGRLTKAITGTQSAQEQAAIVMDSYAERAARTKAKLEDMKLSLFSVVGDSMIWTQHIIGMMVPVAQLMPLLSGLWNGMKGIALLNWGAMWGGIRASLVRASVAMTMMTDATALNNGVSLGFIGNMGRATITVMRFATVGIWNGIKALGAYMLSLVTGGAASATFASISTVSFTAFKMSAVSACRAISVAIMNIPLIGWIIAAIAAIGALFAYFWKTSAKFRAVIKGLWAAIKVFFSGIINYAKTVFGALGDLITAAFRLDGKGIKAALGKFGKAYTDFGKQMGKAFSDAYDKEIRESGKKQTSKGGKSKAAKSGVAPPALSGGLPGLDSSGTTDSKTGKGGSGGSEGIRNVTVTVDKLIDRFEIHTTNLAGDLTKVKEMVTETLLSALNDVNLATN